MVHPTHYTFNAESRVGELPYSNSAFDIDTLGSEIGHFFESFPEVPGIIITRGASRVAALSQTAFLRKISQPFGIEIFYKRPIWAVIEVSDHRPMLVMPEDLLIPDAIDRCLARQDEDIYEPFLIKCEQDNTVRMVDFRMLMLGSSQVLAHRNRQLDAEIVERKRAEEELCRYRNQLEELVAVRTAELEEKYALLAAEIFERQQTEMALRRSQQRLRLLFETMLQGVIHHDCDGQITLLNPAAERILGQTIDDLREWPVQDPEHPALREDGMPLPIIEHPALVALRTRREVRDVVLKIYNPQEQAYRWLNVNAVPLFREGDENVCEVYAVFDDITERKNAEALRLQMEVQARHAQKMESIGQLAAGIAHEINTPIQYIGDNIRFLKDAFADLQIALHHHGALLESVKTKKWTAAQVAAVEKAVKDADVDYLETELPTAIEQSQDGIERVARIVRAMKEFSHPGTVEKVAIDLNQAIDSTLTVCRNEWKYVAKLVTHFDPELPPVTCLPGEINQTVLNIVVNGAHAIADVVGDGANGQGTITVSTKRDGDCAEIRISDTGTGIPERVRDHVFNAFFTTKKVGEGTGQGLAIAHNVIVEKHGGTIHFETETGRGTTFIIRLPLHPSASIVNGG